VRVMRVQTSCAIGQWKLFIVRLRTCAGIILSRAGWMRAHAAVVQLQAGEHCGSWWCALCGAFACSISVRRYVAHSGSCVIADRQCGTFCVVHILCVVAHCITHINQRVLRRAHALRAFAPHSCANIS